MTVSQNDGRRIALLDLIRGVAVIYMVFYHLMYDLSEIFALPWASAVLSSQEHVVVFDTALFIFMAGITVRFSRQPAKHGARILCIAALFTIVTAIVFPGSAIYFGILHLIGTSMLVYCVLGRYLDRIPWWCGAAIFAIPFILTFRIYLGYLGIRGLFTIPVPDIFYSQPELYPFGLPGYGFSSVDYTPLMPWLFLFLCGSCVGRLFDRELPERFYKSLCAPIEWIGRRSLLIYILHQPLIFGALLLIFSLKG